MDTLNVCALGPTTYRDGLRLQEGLVRARAEGRTGDWLLFPDHPPVLTVGRGAAPGGLVADPGTLVARGIEIFEVARGGDITWHGPGQLVGYAICDLGRHDRDLHRFLRALEGAVGDVLAGYGIQSRTVPGRTGVWVGEQKIASLGIAVRRWVSYHGFALNVTPDLSFFDLIHPCGLRGVRMTSIAERLGDRAPALAAVRERAAAAVARRLGHEGVRWAGVAEAEAAAREAETANAVR
ncbi:MAG TPA: lipoyl(octanoyl) transferase LipB [Candidatus Eisenbacteria bacterium]|jgi:lipoate-protein ligase B